MKTLYPTTYAILLLSVLVSPSAPAAEFMTAKGSDSFLSIGGIESHKNLYAGGTTVSITSETTGDLTVAGGTVIINGGVEKGLLAAAGNLTINAPIGENARVAGATVIIAAPIRGDLVVAGGTVHLTSKARVGGDLLVSGGTIVIDAPVKGMVRVRGGEVSINNSVGGKIEAQIGSHLTFGPNAQVAGTISYSAPKLATVASGAKLGELKYNTPPKSGSFAGFLLGSLIIQFLAWFFAAWLLLHFFRAQLIALTASIRQTPWALLGRGSLVALVMPVAALLLLITVAGYYLAALTIAIFGFLLMLATPVAAIFLGQFALESLKVAKDKQPNWKIALVGVPLYQVLFLIPVLGWIAMSAIYLMALGALAKRLQTRIASGKGA